MMETEEIRKVLDPPCEALAEMTSECCFGFAAKIQELASSFREDGDPNVNWERRMLLQMLTEKKMRQYRERLEGKRR